MSGDFFLALGVLLVLAIPIAVIVLIVMVVSLSKRLTRVEARLTHLMDAPRPAAPVAATDDPKPEPRVDPAPQTATPPAKVTADAAGPWGGKASAGPRREDAAPTPRPATASPPPSRNEAPTPPQGPDFATRASRWLSTNWFYVVAAAALSLAGIFLVQYGVERGLLPPAMRVAAALIFGAALIVGGEYVRRRFGDEGDTATAYLPSVFSGAGVVTIFGALLAARHLYDLIGPGMSLTGLTVAALGAIVLGWFHGPLLVAVGLIGGALAPFIVGGSSDSVDMLHGYFALLGIVGLAVDAVRRWPWRWISFLALAAGFGGIAMLLLLVPTSSVAALIAAILLLLASMALPVRRTQPDHPAPMLHQLVQSRAVPSLEVVLSATALAAATFIAFVSAFDVLWLSVGALVIMFGAVAIWAAKSEGLQDQAIIPVLGLGAVLATQTGLTPSWALIAGGAMSVLAAGRSVMGGDTTHRIGWAVAAVVIAPATGLLLDIFWNARDMVGAYGWSLHALGVAAGLTLFAGIWAKRDGEDRLRASLAALFAFTTIGYALAQVAGPAALTASIAALAAGAAVLDRQLRLPMLSWFVVLAAPFCGFRLVAEPGWTFALEGPVPQVALSFGGVIIGFSIAWWLLRGQDRPAAEVSAETAALSALGLAGILVIWRGSDALGISVANMSLGLTATIWLLLAWVQLTRSRRITSLRRIRLGLAAVFGLLAAGALAIGLSFGNPLMGFFDMGDVVGPPILNTMLFAYLLPAALLWLIGLRWTRWAAVALAGLWLILNIRLLWQGPDQMALTQGMGQGELTSYTVAMLILGAVLFYQGVAKSSDGLRRVGTGVLGLTAAKVFLIDAASLTGLLRVGAFVALAFSLVGLAWLNRWAGGAPMGSGPDGGDDQADQPDGEEEPPTKPT